jgi:hypothetical protein
MRTKRAQRWLSKRPTPLPSSDSLPDPFSKLNPDLVEDEYNREFECPCCIDRAMEIQMYRENEPYLTWVLEIKGAKQ